MPSSALPVWGVSDGAQKRSGETRSQLSHCWSHRRESAPLLLTNASGKLVPVNGTMRPGKRRRDMARVDGDTARIYHDCMRGPFDAS